MNGTNTTFFELHNLSIFQDGDDDFDDIDDDDGLGDMVGVVPRHVYLGFIYFILGFGSIGNACIIALMQDKDFHNMSYSVYLQVLAVSDTLLLVTVGVEDILDHQYGRLGHFVTSSVAFCKFWNYVANVFRLSSPWLVVSMTADRFAAVVFPLKRSFLCSRSTAIVVSSLVMATAFGEAVYHIVLSKPFPEEGACDPPAWDSLENYYYFRTLVLETSLPCVLIFFLNVYIITVINRSRKFRAAAAAGSQEKAPRVDKATVSLLAVSIMAFVALIPISALQVAEWRMDKELAEFERDLINNKTQDVEGFESLEDRREEAGDIWPALNLVFLFNFGHNFYVMLITGPRFRQKVITWFRCFRRMRRQDPSSQATNSYRDTEESKVEDRF
ncbi:growth hormone secretagogue receptor type 1 [Elysia marginata]|uniref:Growth hormone secretagogue receptor type 1 n=1 Tax=Elysia marginata TaxID=1093978 RepID=A0AAV4J553_9GAST|nr:growth hormone secretagogue receptor type 1 [Elysia marginata]